MKIREVFVSWKFKKPLILNNQKKIRLNFRRKYLKVSVRQAEKKNLSEQSPHWRFSLHPIEENSTEISV